MEVDEVCGVFVGSQELPGGGTPSEPQTGGLRNPQVMNGDIEAQGLSALQIRAGQRVLLSTESREAAMSSSVV